MLEIRRPQVDVFREQLLERFEEQVLVHVQEFFPKLCKTLGEDDTRALIRHGIERARGYGIEREKDVCKYVDISCVFGRDFDTEQPWAPPILRSATSGEQRIQALFDVAVRSARDV
jgi:hypothetical protein